MSGHNKIEIDPNLPYQKNEIGMSGILYFTAGLFLLIVITFGLMYIFQYYVLEAAWDAEDKKNESPMALSKEERLPPEPRLQAAPGFGVESKDGWVNLELREPQAEYNELLEQWEEKWEKGERDPKTNTVISLPMKDAKEKVLTDGSIKSVSPEVGEQALEDATMTISGSSAGRKASERIR